MAETSSQRVARMLGIVTYVHHEGVVDQQELADHFGISPAQLKKDLDTLWFSGLPGHVGGDLIEVIRSEDEVQIANVEHMGITDPLRLSTDEGIALLAGVEALAQVPGIADPETISQVREILATALGQSAAHSEVQLELIDQAVAVPAEISEAVRVGLDSGRRLEITYVSNSDETTTRQVDPLRILASEGHTYLRAWCYRAQGERAFRLDRISRADVLETPVAEHGDISADFSLTPDEGEEVELEVTSPAQWVLTEIGARDMEYTERGMRATVTVGNPAWFQALLLSLGSAALSVTPSAHQKAVAEAARRALANYELLGS